MGLSTLGGKTMKRRNLFRPLVLLGLMGVFYGGLATAKTKSSEPVALNNAYRLQIEFKPGSAKVDPKYDSDIGNVAHVLDIYPYASCDIKGYTDNIGSAEVNKRISAARAEGVRQVMITKFRIQPDRITVHGYGPEDPVASNATEEGRKQNRRIVAVITGQPPGGY